MSDRYAFDASAILCLIRAEADVEIVKAALPRGVVSAVNPAEVVAKMVEFDMDETLISRVLDPLDLRVVPFEAVQANASGHLRRATRALGLSLGDRACLACAAHLGLTALTMDRAWGDAATAVSIECAR